MLFEDLRNKNNIKNKYMQKWNKVEIYKFSSIVKKYHGVAIFFAEWIMILPFAYDVTGVLIATYAFV